MRGRCRFLSFVVEDMESERCNMPHTPGGFFFLPQKRCNSFNEDHLHENYALSYFDNNL